MFIVLTNLTEGHQGNKVAIRKDIVVSVHHKFDKDENGILTSKTYVFCPPHGTWEVSEPLEEIVKILNEK